MRRLAIGRNRCERAEDLDEKMKPKRYGVTVVLLILIAPLYGCSSFLAEESDDGGRGTESTAVEQAPGKVYADLHLLDAEAYSGTQKIPGKVLVLTRASDDQEIRRFQPVPGADNSYVTLEIPLGFILGRAAVSTFSQLFDGGGEWRNPPMTTQSLSEFYYPDFAAVVRPRLVEFYFYANADRPQMHLDVQISIMDRRGKKIWASGYESTFISVDTTTDGIGTAIQTKVHEFMVRALLDFGDSQYQQQGPLQPIPPTAQSIQSSEGANPTRAGVSSAAQSSLPLPPAPGTSFRDCAQCPEMVVLPAGSFIMGSPDSETGRNARPSWFKGPAELPQHRVTITRAFAVGKYEITFNEWDACVADGGCGWHPPDDGWGRDRRPVINVNWADAQAYASWLSKKTGKSYRLLSETEWEYAVRAGSDTRYPWGEQSGLNFANFYGSGSQWSGQQTAPVGSFPPNRFGLYDMIGNVSEWLQDCRHPDYEGAPTDERAWESGESGNCDRRLLRGGDWSTRPWFARAALRNADMPSDRQDRVGFRIARSL
jgi:formylglycine-generating enzyme required for sulfatase activity